MLSTVARVRIFKGVMASPAARSTELRTTVKIMAKEPRNMMRM